MKHPTNIPGWDGTLAELATAVENMRYDKTAEFLIELQSCFYERFLSDHAAGKVNLANHLIEAANQVLDAYGNMRDAWNICKPHMDIEEKED